MIKTKKEKTSAKKAIQQKKKLPAKAHKASTPKKAVPKVKAVRKPAPKEKKPVHPALPSPILVFPRKGGVHPAPREATVIKPPSKIQKILHKEKEVKPAPAAIESTPKPAPQVKEKPAPIAAEKPPVQKPEAPLVQAAPAPAGLKILELELPVTVKDLAVKLQEKPSLIIKALMGMGFMVGINQALDEPVAAKICQKYGYAIKKAPGQEEIALRIHEEPDKKEALQPRAPVVTFMGHVDHGKTSLLDAIRKTKVVDSEHGGITQHIGAYRVVLPHGEITFLDTPGHEAFTAMRSRGASVTDLVVLVVAADDGIMPQTQEAIDHARAAGVPIIVAINKIDKPQADIDRVKKQLSELNLAAEDWGGKTITVPVSAKTQAGVDDLLEMILLEAEMLQLKANPKRPAKGIVLESKLSKGRGPVATLLVQNGTLHLNKNIIVGKLYGKIRAMFNSIGQSVTEAGPSVPVEILGVSGIPQAGEQFFVIEDEKEARGIAGLRQEKERQLEMKSFKRISLEDLHAQIEEGKLKELKLIIKADVQGSLEAIKDTLNKLQIQEIKLDIIHEGVGGINSSDVILAVASNALILGFNITADDRAKELIAKEGVDARTYNIIYELANDIKQALEGMLEPKLKKIFMGRAEVRKVFKLSKGATIAGCFMVKGKIMRTSLANLVRNGALVFEGKISSLKRFKDDVREVQEGFECGIALAGFEDFKEGDVIEAYEIEKIVRKL